MRVAEGDDALITPAENAPPEGSRASKPGGDAERAQATVPGQREARESESLLGRDRDRRVARARVQADRERPASSRDGAERPQWNLLDQNRVSVYPLSPGL